LENSLFNELKRRNVFRVALAYLVIAWLVAQVSDLVLEAIAAPEWVMQTLLFLLGLGFIASLIISWAYEVTPDGIKREVDITKNESITNLTAKKLDTITIFAVVVLVGLTVWQGLRPNSRQLSEEPTPAQTQTPTQVNSISAKTKNETTAPTLSKNISDRSIAVLPFINRSRNKDDQFFVDGIQDDLLTKLAKIHQMKVISRTSVMEYRNTTKKIPQIAKELGVANILEGGVQRSGSHIRINAQLIHAATDEHLWAETYDKELNIDNVFAIQSEIAVAIAGAMKATLTMSEKEQINKPLTENLIAWEAYNRGLSNNSSSMKGFEESSNNFKKAIKLDPNFANAHAALAQILMTIYWYDSSRIEIPAQAWEAIQKSRSIDNNSADLFSAEAAYYYFGFRDYDKALAATNKAIALSPNFAPAYEIKGYTLRRMGRFDDSIAALEVAASLNPRTTYALQENAETLSGMLRYAEAENTIRRIRRIKPEDLNINFIEGLIALRKDGDIQLALDKLSVIKGNNSGTARYYWYLLSIAGELDSALEFALSSKHLVSSGYRYTSNNKLIGLSYFLKGDTTNAKQYLNFSIKELEIMLASDQENKNYLLAICQSYAAFGDLSKAEQYCTSAIKHNNDAYDFPRDIYQVIQAYGMLNDKHKVLKYMTRLLESQVRPSYQQLMHNPFLKNFRELPEFKVLAKRIDSGELVSNNYERKIKN